MTGTDRKTILDRRMNRRGELRPMAKQSLVRGFFLFIKHEKEWWLVPLILVLLIVGVVVVFAGSSPIAPFLCSRIARSRTVAAVGHIPPTWAPPPRGVSWSLE